MKKTTAILLTALFGLMGLGASAQTQDNQACQRQCPMQNAGDMNKMRQPREFTEFAFEGILLDIDQQTRIDSLNAAVKANMPQRDGRPDCKDGKRCEAAANCPDNAYCTPENCPKDKKECKDAPNCPKQGRDKAKKDSPKAKKGDVRGSKVNHGDAKMRVNPYGPEYIAKVKEILTPNQYVIFLENIVEYQGNKGAAINCHGPKANCNAPNGKKMPKGGRHNAEKVNK